MDLFIIRSCMEAVLFKCRLSSWLSGTTLSIAVVLQLMLQCYVIGMTVLVVQAQQLVAHLVILDSVLILHCAVLH